MYIYTHTHTLTYTQIDTKTHTNTQRNRQIEIGTPTYIYITSSTLIYKTEVKYIILHIARHKNGHVHKVNSKNSRYKHIYQQIDGSIITQIHS